MGLLNQGNIVVISSATLLGLAYVISAAYRLGQRSSSQRYGTKVDKKIRDTLLVPAENDHEEGEGEGEEEDSTAVSSQSFILRPIGQISSVYRLCVGTPRQGLLAPNSRGRIDLYPNRISSDSVIDLQKFSHVWVVFIFHLNSNNHVVNRSSDAEAPRQFPAKIAPPALGGKRVGVFSTRSPHRPNPVGVTLCKIDSVVVHSNAKKSKTKGSKVEPFSINLSGLDLVDGTPVLDIKPYVPHYDSVGYNEDGMSVKKDERDQVKLPIWISEGLVKRRPVIFTLTAAQSLETIMKSDKVYGMEFFGLASGRDKSVDSGLASVKACIIEVLGVDVRSSWQTKKARKGKSQAEKSIRVKEIMKDNTKQLLENKPGQKHNGSDNSTDSIMCTQQLDNLLIKYTIDVVNKEISNGAAVNTDGSGADDIVTVRDIEPISQEYELPNEDKINFSAALNFWSKAIS